MNAFIEQLRASVDDDADVLGEVLRAMTFSEKGGAYANFLPRSGWEEVAPEVKDFFSIFDRFPEKNDGSQIDMFDYEGFSDEEEMAAMTTLENADLGIRCSYYWDGDGVLAFTFDDNRYISNSDCKKDYGWEWGTIPLPL